MKYAATYSFNVRRYIKREIEAESHEEAERIAKAEAEQHISEEDARLQNAEGFGDAAPWDAYLYVDAVEGDDDRVVCECALEDLDA